MKILMAMINYNTSLKTISCLKSVLNLNTVHNLDIIVIDNSTNIKEKIILKEYLEILIDNKFLITYVDSNGNIGYAKAMNPQIKKALEYKYDYIWLLNNDLELESNALDILISFAIAHPKGIYCSLQKDFVNRNKIIETGTINMDSFKGYAIPTYKNSDEFIEVDAVLGASLVIDVKIVEETNIFLSEHYFIYMEENDYCYRMKLLGYKSYVVMKSIVYHEAGGSGGTGNPLIWYYRIRNLLLFKYEFQSNRIKVFLLGIYFIIMTIVRYRLKINFVKASIFAFIDAYFNRNEKSKREF
ncbi:glycosyltransferase family 2 protein [Sulfurospirillum sp. UCH001]|uniref:glycosyltransferase family 2 protein n=1 Tax=Sulfurospirillum sp. UCH001 TaxID=1581011 RepID=UPI00082BBE7F|nr:glycosyltransferase family 2 protein [Sulfurospirillum sp. UCH001]